MSSDQIEDPGAASRTETIGYSRLPFGTFRYDARIDRMWWSDEVFGILGFEGGDVVPSVELFASHQHPDDRTEWRDGFQRVLNTGEPACRRYRIVDARRQVRFVLSTVSATRDDASVIVGLSGFLVDLTGTLRDYHADQVTRAVLRSAESRPTIEQAKGILMASFDLTDEQAFNLLRLHSSYSNIKLRDVAAAVVEGIADPTLTSLAPRPRVAAILATLAGDRLPVLPVPSSGRSLPDLDVEARSVTKGLSPADLPRTLVRAVAGAGQSITISDFLAPDQPLVYANSAFVGLTGYATGDIIGTNCRFLQGPDTDRVDIAAMRKALARGQEVRTVLLNYRQDGSTFWNELHLSAVRDDSGRVTHYIGYQVDVSERVQREQQLLQLANFDGSRS